MRHNPIVFVTWGLLVLAYLEFLLAKKHDLTVYSSSQTLATIGLGIGHLFVGLTVIEALLRYIDSSLPNKLFTLPPGLIWGVCAFLVLDFLKYVAHRLAHQVGFLWAEHAVHHAAIEFNFTTHLRHGWLGFLSSGMLVSALCCLVGGLHTVLIIYFFINTLMQMIAHTQLIHKLGFLESILVTPSHHRVHHAVDRAVHDNNYGNVFIVWDKLLGTFKSEGATQTTEFGLAYAPKVEAPLWKHAFFAWIDLIKNYANKALNASRI
ncbi:MAG TPA: sterol desaturase family protein [Burkholderiaceae bacterium]|nr:sterol desaturase family protein [Burkholderiaceae bacterium]